MEMYAPPARLLCRLGRHHWRRHAPHWYGHHYRRCLRCGQVVVAQAHPPEEVPVEALALLLLIVLVALAGFGAVAGFLYWKLS